MEAAAKMIGMARRNVMRNWRHSIATILAIASGFTAVSLFDGFLRELDNLNTDGYSKRGMLGQVVIEAKDAQLYEDEDPWKYSLDAKQQAQIDLFLKQDPDFVQRVRFLEGRGIVYSGNTSAVFVGHGYDVMEGLQVRGDLWAWNTVAGKPLHEVKIPSAVIGRSMGRLLNCEAVPQTEKFVLPAGNYVPVDRPFTCAQPRLTISATTENAQVNAIDLPLSGMIDAAFREADKRALSMALADMQRLMDTDKVTRIAVTLKDPGQTQAFMARFQAFAAREGLALDTTFWEDHKLAAYVKGGMQLLSVFRNLFMVIVVTIGVMSVANTMMKAVAERTREIGTLRSLGFLRRELTFVFAAEGFFLSALACAVGFIAALGISFLISKLHFTYKAGVLSTPIELRVAPAPMAWLISALVLSVLATGTAWFCARKASRLVIADALRHV